MKVFLSQIEPYLGEVDKNLDMMTNIIKEQIKNAVDIIVFPELALTGYLLESMTFDVAIEKVPSILLELSKQISIIFGAVELGKDMYHYNTVFYLEDGKIKHKHRKVYLASYGLFDEHRYFKEGDKIRAFDTKFGRIGMLICEDMFHQTSSYILAQDGAKIIFTVVNSPTRFIGKELKIKDSWRALATSTAVSNCCFVLMVNRTGVEDGVNFWGGSFAVNSAGELIASLKEYEKDGVEINIDKNEIKNSRFNSSSKYNDLNLILDELYRVKKNRQKGSENE